MTYGMRITTLLLGMLVAFAGSATATGLHLGASGAADAHAPTGALDATMDAAADAAPQLDAPASLGANSAASASAGAAGVAANGVSLTEAQLGPDGLAVGSANSLEASDGGDADPGFWAWLTSHVKAMVTVVLTLGADTGGEDASADAAADATADIGATVDDVTAAAPVAGLLPVELPL